ncbi:MAG TPA: hypothetical protein VGY58_12075 [Gemmataceae bacterium]|jgi:hypothetical protein|nr:hypothetical protein [Gemmataceae bacterium]
MTTWREATDEDCMLCQHLLCDDGGVLGLVVRYYEDVTDLPGIAGVCGDQVMSRRIGCAVDRPGGARSGRARAQPRCRLLQLRDVGLTAAFAVGLTFFSDARRGCAFPAAFF